MKPSQILKEFKIFCSSFKNLNLISVGEDSRFVLHRLIADTSSPVYKLHNAGYRVQIVFSHHQKTKMYSISQFMKLYEDSILVLCVTQVCQLKRYCNAKATYYHLDGSIETIRLKISIEIGKKL